MGVQSGTVLNCSTGAKEKDFGLKSYRFFA